MAQWKDFWGILKRERYYGKVFTSKIELKTMIETYIEYYNTRRLQRKLGIVTPFEKYEMYCVAAWKKQLLREQLLNRIL